MTLYVFLEWNIWKIFLLGIPGQIAILLWFRLFRSPKTEEVTAAEAAPEHGQEDNDGQA